MPFEAVVAEWLKTVDFTPLNKLMDAPFIVVYRW